jgi:hypothetical protein
LAGETGNDAVPVSRKRSAPIAGILPLANSLIKEIPRCFSCSSRFVRHFRNDLATAPTAAPRFVADRFNINSTHEAMSGDLEKPGESRSDAHEEGQGEKVEAQEKPREEKVR